MQHCVALTSVLCSASDLSSIDPAVPLGTTRALNRRSASWSQPDLEPHSSAADPFGGGIAASPTRLKANSEQTPSSAKMLPGPPAAGVRANKHGRANSRANCSQSSSSSSLQFPATIHTRKTSASGLNGQSGGATSPWGAAAEEWSPVGRSWTDTHSAVLPNPNPDPDTHSAVLCPITCRHRAVC